MNKNTLNDWLQIAAAVGVILGLVLVAFEIRQNSEVAKAEAFVAVMDTWTAVTLADVDPDLAAVIAKSFEEDAELSNTEMVMLGSWLQAIVQAYVEQIQLGPDVALAGDIVKEFESDSFYFFGTEFSRAWYAYNRYWILPELAEVVDEHIKNNPPGGTLAYFEDIRQHMREQSAARQGQQTR